MADDRSAAALPGVTFADLLGLVAQVLPLPVALHRMAEYAQASFPEIVGVAVDVFVAEDPAWSVAARHLVAATSPVFQLLNGHQYGEPAEGPGVTALGTGRAVRSDSLDRDARWPRFAAQAERVGIRSVVALPLLSREDGALGALNFYAAAPGAFSAAVTVRDYEPFAAATAAAIETGLLLARAQPPDQFAQAMADRAVIDQALGAIRFRTGCSSSRAMALLREYCGELGLSLTETAMATLRAAQGDADDVPAPPPWRISSAGDSD